LRSASRCNPAIKVRALLPRDLLPVLVDPDQLGRTIHAAAENAREAMREGGVLTLAASNADGGRQVRLLVSDSGSGMSPDVRERAFEPFFTTKPVGGGPGLGLSQVHGFVEQSGGRVELESEAGRGTTLIMMLPAAQSAPATPEAARPAPAGTRVLLVEDSDTVAAFAEAMLTGMGMSVRRAANADEALDALAAGDEFDILFSDIVMPGMSGIELAEHVHAERPALPILLATAYSEAAAREGTRFPILPKPYRRDALAEMMGRALAA
jgi:CheY-like chemotaxis protein